MGRERKLTPLGKLIILLFIAGCFYGAYYLFMGRGQQKPATTVPPATASKQEEARPAAPAPAQQQPAVEVLGDILKRRELRVAYEGDAPPMYYLPAAGPPTRGFEFELSRRLAGDLGVPSVSFVAADYAELPALVRERKADVLIAGYVPDPSIDGIEWSKSYLDFGLCLIVLQSSAVTEPEHLKGKTVAVYDDPAAIRWVQENIPNARIVTFSGESGWFEALESREADGLVYDYPFAATEIKAHPRAKIVKFNLNRAHYAIGLAARNDKLLDAVNAGLDRILASPSYAELVREYMPYRSENLTKAVAGARNTYTVREGDTLARVAGKVLGSAERWTEIWELNRSRIPNPHLIYPDYVLVLP